MLREKEAMKGEMDRRMIYGSKEFIEKVTKEHNIEAVKRQKRETEEREKGRKIEPSLLLSLLPD